MKKGLNAILFLFILINIALTIIPFSPVQYSDALTEGGKAKVIVSRCYLHTADSLSSEKVTYAQGEDTILVVLEYGDIVNIESVTGEFAFVTTANEKEGYIYKYYITQNTSQAVYPVFNASVRKDTIIYDINKNATEYTAKKGTRVYIYKGFDDKEKYTAIQIVLDDESVYNGYILTEDIDPDGISGVLIIAISIIVAGVTIILSLVYIKKKKSKSSGK